MLGVNTARPGAIAGMRLRFPILPPARSIPRPRIAITLYPRYHLLVLGASPGFPNRARPRMPVELGQAMLAIEQYTRRLLKDFHPIVAANRPPVDLAPDAGDGERFVRGSGGLVTGLSGLAQATGAVWVASVRDGFEGELELGNGGEPMMVETTDGSPPL